jgi:virginiamycin B lyase
VMSLRHKLVGPLCGAALMMLPALCQENADAILSPQTLTITVHRVSGGPDGITTGPDGALWFTESAANKIGRMTMNGMLTEYEVPTPISGVGSISVGPDRALWFAENQGNYIGRITTDGVFSEYVVPTPASGPAGITTGPDGALWFTENTGNNIGRLSTNGTFTEYAVPTFDARTVDIATGSDGALWFTEFGPYANKIRPGHHSWNIH